MGGKFPWHGRTARPAVRVLGRAGPLAEQLIAHSAACKTASRSGLPVTLGTCAGEGCRVRFAACHLLPTLGLFRQRTPWLKATATCVVGRARAIPRCGHCLSENYVVAECPDLPQGLPAPHHLTLPTRTETAGTVPPRARATTAAAPSPAPASAEYCRLFNQVRCRSRRCRYLHLCLTCSIPHPELVCPSHGRHEIREQFPSSTSNASVGASSTPTGGLSDCDAAA